MIFILIFKTKQERDRTAHVAYIIMSLQVALKQISWYKLHEIRVC